MGSRGALLLPGMLAAALAAPSEADSQQCRRNSECDASLTCRGGSCVIECRESRDCEGGTLCVNPGWSEVGICVERDAIAPGWFPNMLRDTVLWGGDIADMPLRRSEPLDCHVACVARTNCTAWSYAPAGMAGRTVPWCYLKSTGFTRRANAGSVSGITRPQVPVQR